MQELQSFAKVPYTAGFPDEDDCLMMGHMIEKALAGRRV